MVEGSKRTNHPNSTTCICKQTSIGKLTVGTFGQEVETFCSLFFAPLVEIRVCVMCLQKIKVEKKSPKLPMDCSLCCATLSFSTNHTTDIDQMVKYIN